MDSLNCSGLALKKSAVYDRIAIAGFIRFFEKRHLVEEHEKSRRRFDGLIKVYNRPALNRSFGKIICWLSVLVKAPGLTKERAC